MQGGEPSMKADAITETNEHIVERIQAGDAEAIGILWTANERLVAYIANRYHVILAGRRDCDFDDLMQAGFIGMHRAAGEYSPDKGAKFSTYAIFHLKREMRRALGILGEKRDPIHNAAPLDAPILDDGHEAVNLIDTLVSPEDDVTIERDELQSAVRAAVGRMKHKAARSAIESYYFEGVTESQQAEAEGVSRALIDSRLSRGYRELYNDPELHRWAVDYEYTNLYRHKGVQAFNTSFSSVVEDIVLQAEEHHNRQAALADVLGPLA
jgi:RNA polymerase sigma factor (sigma-70 family)